jgi:glucose-6-phosphate 1-dehydrogenase
MSGELSNRLPKEYEPHTFIIFGATGDLSRRKLFPAIYQLSSKGALAEKSIILGVARNQDYNDHSFRVLGKEMLQKVASKADTSMYPIWCEKCLYYQPLAGSSEDGYKNLSDRIASIEKENELPGNRVFYLALPPQAVFPTIEGLGRAGLNKSPGWTRIVMEKPFGQDIKSAKELNNHVHKYFDESQIYRIDHFLGKETVQNLIVFRFANTLFEELWDHEHISSIQITVAEDLGIEGRAGYYEQTGALRDMVQNHLAQLLTLVTMEYPAIFEADSIRYEKAKVLHQIAPLKPEDVVFGQYTRGSINGNEVPGYQDEPGVSGLSQRETFVSMQLEIANWRWKGVPIFMRTGKRLPRRMTRIEVRFHAPPVSVFSPFDPNVRMEPNVLVITLQPDEGFDLQFQVKSIGQPVTLSTQKLHFRYSEAFGPIPEAYETLLLDVILGDQTLFVSSDEVEKAWKIFSPLIGNNIPAHPYLAGTWGPPESDQLLERWNTRWSNPTE